ncbi:integrator complex subunit 10-like [Ruditapes philippinarum]|uniref:integrator complex subunit 10-like n=1 Tax=Ruditapes philippinarum TaxID=129788 RepID=UPI00295BDB2E|nr:integrator complex subunit 10-like [Ruditapes philippinarum]
MAAVTGGELSDEEWLVSRARACFKADPYAAKSWMLTARTLFPNSFNIQFEAYNLEKQAKNSKEAAKLLESLYLLFPEERRLWSEVHSILDALQNETADQTTAFLTEILTAIPTQVQCQMLLSVSEKISDKLEQCRLLLLALKKFPNLVKEHGRKLVDTLLSAETHAQFQSPVNCYRKLLVCDVLPLVLKKGSQVKVLANDLYVWLQKCVEFYISFVTQPPPSSHEPTTPLSPDLMSPTKKCRRANIPGLHDKECLISDPWAHLYKLLIFIGQNVGWEIDKDFFTKSREFQWQHILSLYNRSNQAGSESRNKQILYTTTVLFLECLYHYICSVDTDIFHSGGSNSVPLVIIEGFKAEQANNGAQPAAKRSKAESLLPQVHATKSISTSQTVIQNFLTAFKCYELLNSSTELQREFVILCNNWRMETWSWMGHFQTDMFLYQGAFQDAVRHLQNYAIGSKTKLQIRHSLQLACCFYCLNNYSRACELILDVVAAFPVFTHQTDSPDSIQENQFVYGSGRHLVLVPCTEAEILPYCIQMLMTCFKDRAFGGKSSDSLLGHTLVLLQYDWPNHATLFSQIIKKIQKQGSFSFNLFFNYIINVDILEEFSFIKTQEGGKIHLDILPISTSAIAQQRTVTRG